VTAYEPAPADLTDEQKELLAKLQTVQPATVPYAAPSYGHTPIPGNLPGFDPTPRPPSLDNREQPSWMVDPAKEARAAAAAAEAAAMAGAERSFTHAVNHARSCLRKLEKAGALKQANLLRLEFAELADEFSVRVAAETERAKQGRTKSGSSRRGDEQKPVTGPVADWVQQAAHPDSKGTLSADLWAAFRTWLTNSGADPNSVTRTRWGRDLTRLGYPAKNVRDGSWVRKNRPLRLKTTV
jgi:hypothetical protein